MPIPNQTLIGAPILYICLVPDRISCRDCRYQIPDDSDSREQELGGEVAYEVMK
jgi:hypothetical protein